MNNSSVQPTKILNQDLSCSDAVTTLFTVLLSIVTLAAFIGNFVVIVSFIKTTSLKTSTNYYIVNMAVSDLFCACFNWPLFAAEGMLTSRQFISDHLASVVCKLGMYFRGISQVVSVLSLVLISVDRYVAIVFPLKIIVLDRRGVRLAFLTLTWIIPIVCGFPYVIYTEVVKVDDKTFCRTVWSRLLRVVFNFIGFVVFYCAPIFVMTILYARVIKTVRNRPNTADKTQDQMNSKRQKQHQKITKILISIVAAFFVCWTPLCIYLSLKMFHPDLIAKDKCLVYVALFFYLFPSFSTAINPVILFLFSSNYRQALTNMSLQVYYFFNKKFRVLGHANRRVGSSHGLDNVVLTAYVRGETASTICVKS